MVPLLDLLWPLLLATCAVFVVSGTLARLLPRRAEPVPVQEGEMPGGTRASRWEGYAAYHLAVNIMVAYLAGLALLPGTDFDTVFRFTTSAAFLGYCSTSIHGWLTERRSWRMVWRPACRGLVCSLVVGSIFAGLWPVQ